MTDLLSPLQATPEPWTCLDPPPPSPESAGEVWHYIRTLWLYATRS